MLLYSPLSAFSLVFSTAAYIRGSQPVRNSPKGEFHVSVGIGTTD